MSKKANKARKNEPLGSGGADAVEPSETMAVSTQAPAPSGPEISGNKQEVVTGRVGEDDDWQKDVADSPTHDLQPPAAGLTEIPSPREDATSAIAAAFTEYSNNQKNLKTHELRIKVAPSEPSRRILEVAEHAIVNSSAFDGRLVLRETRRSILEVQSRPVTIDITLSQDLDRIVLIKAYEPVPDQLFSTLRDAFSNQVQLSMRVQDSLAGVEEEHEEPVDGPSVSRVLDADYVAQLKKEMQQRSERDLTAFATPLERRAKDDEKRVLRLEKILTSKYNACHLPLPELEKAPPLSSFPLERSDPPATLTLRRNATPREVDAQLKMAIRRDLHGESLARQERKKKEVLARAEACERNRLQLVTVISNSRAALELDLELMSRLGIHPPQVAMCRVPCLYARKPGHLIVCQQIIVFEPVGFMGWRMSGTLKLPASQCRSVMKGRATLGLVDSLCVRMDNGQEHLFYMATIEDTNEVLDQAFELIWQVLRMNRWDQDRNEEGAVIGDTVTV